MRKGRRVQSGGLSAAKYKGPKMADERKKVGKAVLSIDNECP